MTIDYSGNQLRERTLITIESAVDKILKVHMATIGRRCAFSVMRYSVLRGTWTSAGCDNFEDTGNAVLEDPFDTNCDGSL